tara:strand:+ start:653 stop:1798 length:1146 start_codon:yes stop_codon:yes gene_type:complete
MKINLLTSSRADFSLLKNLIFEMQKNKKFKLKLIATGSHFSKKLGNSYKEILESKIKIHHKIKISNNISSPKKLLKDMGTINNKLAGIINSNKPDLFIVLGDRHEVLFSALTAYISKIPIAHIHGGELTLGSLDDGYRHSITKLSSIHFASHREYKNRIIQLGEQPKFVFNVGGLGAENIKKTRLLNRNQLEKKLKIKFKNSIFTINIQPEISKEKTILLTKEVLQVLNKQKEKTLIFTLPGSDKFNEIIIKKLRKFVKKNTNAYLFKTLGGIKFLSCLKISDAIIGNSSSGILEMPSFKNATINIGNRQKGRIKAKSIIDVKPKSSAINKAVKFIYSKKFRLIKSKSFNPYYKKSTAKKIVKIVNTINLKKLKIKTFYNL